jgi:hypothetical protein
MAHVNGSWGRLAIEATKCEAARLIRMAAGPEIHGETAKQRIHRTAEKLGWPRTRVRHIWHREAQRIDVHEMDQLRALTAIPSENSESCCAAFDCPHRIPM